MDFNDTLYYLENYLSQFDFAISQYDYFTPSSGEKIKLHAETIFTNVLTDVLEYCKNNDVKVVEFDDVKIIYFIGKETSRLENNNEYLKIAVGIMNSITIHSTGNGIDFEMLNKIYKAIDKNRWHEEYGNNGIYTLFKTMIRTYSK